jgi:hypothetical protein
MYTNATYRPNIDESCGRLPDLFERTESGDAVARADCGSRSLLLGDRAEKGFAMMSNFWAGLGSTAQYLCQETRTDENKESPPIGLALDPRTPATLGCSQGNFTGRHPCEHFFHQPQRFSRKGGDTDPAAYSTYRYDGGETFSFRLDNAMAIIVEDDKTNEIAIDTCVMPRYTKHK